MISDDDVRGLVQRLFPIRGERFEVSIADDTERLLDDAGALVAAIRLVTYDDDGAIRDVKEQTLELLPARHRDPRGARYLEACCARLGELTFDDVELAMPMDFFAPAVLDAVVDANGFERVLANRRARYILALAPPDPVLLSTIDPARRPEPPMLVDAELEARILERPDDRELYAVYGDWLAERGDPRGELVAVQLAREVRPDDERLRERERELLHEYAFEWLGGYAWLPPHEFSATWRRGFVHGICIGSAEPPPDGSYTDVTLDGLEQIPCAAMLRELELRPHSYWGDEALVRLGSPGFPARWTRLVIDTPEYASLGELEPAYPNLGRLRELVIDARAMELGAIELPALRSLELVTRGLTVENLTSIREARWPELQRLVLWLGEYEQDDCDITLDDLDWILAGEGLASVRELGLCGREPAELLERIARAPILGQLETLDLAGSFLDDAGVQWVNDHAGAFAHLRALRLPPPLGVKVPPLPRNAAIDRRFVPVYE